MFRIELKYQNLTVEEYRLRDGDIRFIGRAPDNHILIDDPTVSHNHCFIIQIDEELFIGDRGGKFLTLVDGIQVICTKLNPGDVVRIGVNYALKVLTTTKGSGEREKKNQVAISQ